MEQASIRKCALLGLVSRRLWFLLIALALRVVEAVAVAPNARYIILTFFAAGYGGGDCLTDPKSQACRRASGDSALYNALCSCLAGALSVLTSLTLGSVSDYTGRRRIILLKGVADVVETCSLGLSSFLGLTLWFYLLASPLNSAMDMSGVFLATINDAFPERQLRAPTLSIFTVIMIFCVVSSLTLSVFLPSRGCIGIAVVITLVRQVFVLVAFPETAKFSGSSILRSRSGPLAAGRAAFVIIWNSPALFRLSCMSVLMAISGSGLMHIMLQYLTAYAGFSRSLLVLFGLVMLTTTFVVLAIVARPLLAHLGVLRVLKLSAILNQAFPVALSLVDAEVSWQVLVVAMLGVWPGMLFYISLSAIKGCLVEEEEQGLIQGAMMSMAGLASTIAAPLFNCFYYICTAGGTAQSSSAVAPPLLLSAAIGLLSLLCSASLSSDVQLSAAMAKLGTEPLL